MKPIRFACEETVAMAPEAIAERILDLDRWSDFDGYGVLPGIETAEFEIRTSSIVGSRIRVHNTDGSRHVEEIVQWDPPRRVHLDLHEFSPPLSRLATRFNETWTFERLGERTRVVRTVEMHARSSVARPLLRGISYLLRKAIGRHLRRIRNTAPG